MTHTLRGNNDSRQVWLNGCQLTPYKSQEVHNHSPDGFAWGYGGSGPAQLALAIMLELDPTNATQVYQDFKWQVLAQLPMSDFFINFEKNGDHWIWSNLE